MIGIRLVGVPLATLKLVFPTRKKCSTLKYHMIFEGRTLFPSALMLPLLFISGGWKEHFYTMGNTSFNVTIRFFFQNIPR